jgi:hypothetical protein
MRSKRNNQHCLSYALDHCCHFAYPLAPGFFIPRRRRADSHHLGDRRYIGDHPTRYRPKCLTRVSEFERLSRLDKR